MIRVASDETRRYTNAVLSAIDDGILPPEIVARDLLGWLSDDDVRRFGEANDLWSDEEDDDEDDV